VPLLSAHSNSTCFEVGEVNGKDRETGDSKERLESGPFQDQTRKLFDIDLGSKKRDLPRLRHIDLAVSVADTTMQQEGKPRFLKFHQGSVRGVAFSPRVGITTVRCNCTFVNIIATGVFRMNQFLFPYSAWV
jgi:hypothetical protein